jgi:hypothetical protein
VEDLQGSEFEGEGSGLPKKMWECTVVLASKPEEGSSMATVTVPSAPAVISKNADSGGGVWEVLVF